MLTSANAFVNFLPLQPANLKAVTDQKTMGSLDAVAQKMDRILADKKAAFDAALAKTSELRRHGRGRNATAIKNRAQAMRVAGIAQANAKKLNSAVTLTIERINNFFAVFEAYEKELVGKKMVGTLQVGHFHSKAAAILAEIDKSLLADAEKFFQLYTRMWSRASDAEQSLMLSGPSFGDSHAYQPSAVPAWCLASNAEQILRSSHPRFKDVLACVRPTAVAVHEWLNHEMNNFLCSHYGGCMKVRSLIFAETEKKANYCDERFTKNRCHNEKGGFAPSGRTCKWNLPHNARKRGLRGYCKSVRPPTAGLRYHQDSSEPGIFY
jgi:hypothetical protein